MDMQQLTAAFTSLKAATEFGRAALEVKNFNEIAPKLSDLNSKLLDAQQALFLHNAQLSELQEQHREATKELAEVKATLAERGRYLLHPVAPGRFVYRAEATTTEPDHFVCQPCFDGPELRKAVLQNHPATAYSDGTWRSPVCKAAIKYANATGGHAPTVLHGDSGPNSWMRG
ncbi:hypothetical protein [Paraburkholderia ferrariae]|jgi:hypothetical protein|uniref:hypothetical protein n=1 Tax=Paraburkholderia ferrariae TaxID=386056 RepID=UPI00048700D4|nr:hypothetical protein [Paraburkholderia ferrariae]